MDWNRKVSIENYTAKDMPEYPARVLIAHVGMKGLQFGSTIGLFITPVISFVRKRPIVSVWRYTMPVASGLGAVLSLSLLGAKYSGQKMGIDGVDDRAYRISKNRGQNEVDRESFIGAMTTTVVISVGTRQVANVIPGFFTGITFGLLYHVMKPKIFSSTDKNSTVTTP